jgi:signal transduction histidine kinase/ligand-binding sensor domain-containing protein
MLRSPANLTNPAQCAGCRSDPAHNAGRSTGSARWSTDSDSSNEGRSASLAAPRFAVLRSLLVLSLYAALLLLAVGHSATSSPVSAQASTPTPIAVPTQVPDESKFDPDLASRPRYAAWTPRARDNDIRFDRLSVEDGLSQSAVNCILQDSKGFMWFATEDGLNKYDGYDFTIFHNDPQDPSSLSDSFVRCIHEDPSGAIWIGTWNGGLDRLDPATGKFTHYRHDPDDPHSLSHDNVLCLYTDQAGTLWVGTAAGLDRFDPRNGHFAHYQHNPADSSSLSDYAVVSIYQDSNDQLWVGTWNGGLNRLEPETEQFARYQHQPGNLESLSDDAISVIYGDGTGALWVGTSEGGLNRMDPEQGTFVRYLHSPTDTHSLSDDHVMTILEDSSGVLWIGTQGGGLDRYDHENDRFIHYRNDPYDPQSLSSNRIRSLYEDRGGVLWVGTLGAGLSKANPTNQKFALYRQEPGNPNSLSDASVWAILEDHEGVLWVGTDEGGLNRFDRESGQWTHYLHDADAPHSLSDNTVRSLYEDRSGALWVGTANGLDRFDRGSGQFVHYRHDPNDPQTLSHNDITTIYEDRSGMLWIGTLGGGLNRLDRQSGRVLRYQADPDNPDAISHDMIACIYETSDGVLWIGTMGGGINALDPAREHFVHYQHDPRNSNSLSHDVVFAIAEDYLGRLYIGTWGDGLDRYNRQTNQFTHFRQKDGLPNNVVYGIVEDNLGYLWLSTNGGLSRLNVNSRKFRNYDVTDGLQSNEFNMGAYYKSSSGELFFGGINGFNALYPPLVVDNPYVPPVVVTAVKRLDRTVLTDVSQTQEIQLSYRDTSVAFEFAALDYTASQKNQYIYMLEGFDANWVNAGTRRYVNYTNLKGGRYVFRVRGANNDGVWNRVGVSIQVTVMPPIWDTWWFRGSVGLLLAGAVIAGFRLRVRSIETRTRELETQVRERTYEIERRRLVAEGLREILVILNSNHSLKESLDHIACQAAQLSGAVRAVIFHPEPSFSDPITLGAYSSSQVSPSVGAASTDTQVGRGRERVADWDLPPDTVEWIERRIDAGEPVVIPSPEGYQLDSSEQPLPSPDPYRAILGTPVSVSGDVYGGLVLFYDREGSFSMEDLELGLTLADHAALAIANAQLHERVEQIATETERSRLARDLHDAVTQTLFSASLISEVLPATWESDQEEGRKLLKELRQLSRGAMAEMRALLLELRPAALVEAGLGDLLRQLAEATAGRTGTPVTTTIECNCTLPPDVHVALYRITQEALNNVMKHAHASQVSVSLRCQSVGRGRASISPSSRRGRDSISPSVQRDAEGCQEVELQVSDDGCGFDPSAVSSEHLGLGIIRERAQAVGAKLEIVTQPERGTQVTVVWKG